MSVVYLNALNVWIHGSHQKVRSGWADVTEVQLSVDQAARDGINLPSFWFVWSPGNEFRQFAAFYGAASQNALTQHLRRDEKRRKSWNCEFFTTMGLSLAKILTSSAFWSNASTSFTRKSKQSSVKRSVRALSNPGGAGDISKGFLLPYCMQFMLRWEKLLSHQLSETHQEIKWDVSWWLAGQVGEDNLQTIRGWVGPHVSTTTWQGKEM